jgi:hypothetical protein
MNELVSMGFKSTFSESLLKRIEHLKLTDVEYIGLRPLLNGYDHSYNIGNSVDDDA